jgi:hypothetical protein
MNDKSKSNAKEEIKYLTKKDKIYQFLLEKVEKKGSRLLLKDEIGKEICQKFEIKNWGAYKKQLETEGKIIDFNRLGIYVRKEKKK